jgi:hypothetical protein
VEAFAVKAGYLVLVVAHLAILAQHCVRYLLSDDGQKCAFGRIGLMVMGGVLSVGCLWAGVKALALHGDWYAAGGYQVGAIVIYGVAAIAAGLISPGSTLKNLEG